MSSVWLVRAGCGDYYCEGEHVVAICASQAQAEQLKEFVENGELDLPGYVSYDVSVDECVLGEIMLRGIYR